MKKNSWMWLGLAVLCLFIIAPLAWLLRLDVYYIPSGAMQPTLRINDRLLADKRAYISQAPLRGDIVVFQAPAAALIGAVTPGAKVDFIKRVVGMPGETVEMVKGRLRVNGKWVAEPWAKWNVTASVGSGVFYDFKIVGGTVYSRDRDPMTSVPGMWTQNSMMALSQTVITRAPAGKIPSDQFLVLGDNHTNSNDSHVWGFVPRSAFLGRVTNVVWPLDHRQSF